MRLDRYLSEAGLGTRSEVKKLIKSGVVRVNGSELRKPEAKLAENDRVEVSGREVTVNAVEYWMLHKPSGYVSATEDRRFPVVTELLPEEARGDLFPVGRLDLDTEGLLLLTNDGKLAHFLLSPKRHVDKVYLARVRGRLMPEGKAQFEEGLDIGDEKKTLPARLEPVPGSAQEEGAGEELCAYRVTIREGRYHQVKRMFAAVGCEVVCLKRLSMGSLKLDGALPCGACRRLTKEEVDRLKEETGC